jgi:hypothetical protein
LGHQPKGLTTKALRQKFFNDFLLCLCAFVVKSLSSQAAAACIVSCSKNPEMLEVFSFAFSALVV